MSVAMTLRLPEFYAERLEQMSKNDNRSKTDLMIEGLQMVIASRLDAKVTYLSDEAFDSLMDILDREPTEEELAKRQKLLSTPYPWESK